MRRGSGNPPRRRGSAPLAGSWVDVGHTENVGLSDTWYDRAMDRTERYTIALGERGRLVLPARRRERLIVTVDAEGCVRIVSAREQARRLRDLYRDLAPGRSLADELIAARREEVQREDPRRWTRRRAQSSMPQP